MPPKKEILSPEKQKNIEAFASMLIADFGKVLDRANQHPSIDVAGICEGYVNTLVYMMMPRSLAIKQAAIYKRREHASVHNQIEKVESADEELASLNQEHDLIDVRLQAIQLLSAGITDKEALATFRSHVAAPEKSGIITQAARSFGGSALRGWQGLRAAFITQE